MNSLNYSLNDVVLCYWWRFMHWVSLMVLLWWMLMLFDEFCENG